MKAEYGLETRLCVEDWTALVSMPRLADAVIISTQDKDHKDPAVAFARAGYHVLLEKPMAVTESDCLTV